MKTSIALKHILLVGLFVLSGCKQQLYTGLSERDANEMIAVLAARNLTADKVATDKGDFRIELDRSDFSAAVEALRDHGLPRPKFSSIGEVFKKEGLVTTANAERLRFMFAMSEELSKTLSLIDGVVEARVHPVLPGGDPLTDKLTPASASVFIKHTSDANLTMLAPAIKDLVCASIEGLTYDKVSLTFVPASKMVTPKLQTPLRASASESLNLSGLPALGIGLSAGLLIVGIGLLTTRRTTRYEEDSQPVSRHSLKSSRPDTQTTAATQIAAAALLKLLQNGNDKWRELIRNRSSQRQPTHLRKASNGAPNQVVDTTLQGGPSGIKPIAAKQSDVSK